MLLYEPTLERNMRDYGITIPIAISRPSQIMAFLTEQGVKFPCHTFASAAEALAIAAPLISRADLERVHSPEYLARLYDPAELERVILSTFELINDDGSYNRYEPDTATKPLTELFARQLEEISGTYLACRLALTDADKFCFYLGGGSHHACYDAGSGFCILNDIIIALRKLQDEGHAGLIWIIDVDAHKGDGSTELVRLSRERGETFSGKNPEIFTLSIHMAQGWPLDEASLTKAIPGHAPLVESDIDIPIESGEEALYLPRLAEGLALMEQRTAGRIPDLALVVDGVDPYRKDGLASSVPLALSLAQCVARDRFIYAFLQERCIPSSWLMAGGYGEHAWKPTARFLASL
ncbi:MAG: histone deacetylase [Treponema sp.]|jgi:acetoin utilization deacetylase AcuC-like enzyme|nr:histone deacetylase [Treponema sp.]